MAIPLAGFTPKVGAGNYRQCPAMYSTPVGNALALPSRSGKVCGRHFLHYTANSNFRVKVLDFVKPGGPDKAELRTFRWEVLI